MMLKMPLKTLPEWLKYLEKSHPVEIEFGLDRISKVAKLLGLPTNVHQLDRSLDQQDCLNNTEELTIATKVITVGGTNGKGSCVAVLDSILREAGYRVGCYTSPHLIKFNERITINGQHSSDLDICLAFEEINKVRKSISLSFFEFSTLAALLIMSNSNLDIAILEVGLGGRLDAVNLIDSQLSIITGVALDHQQWLGSDLDSIAREKAAIGRSGIVMLYGDTKPVHGLVQAARNLNVKLLLNGKDFCFDDFDISNLTYLPHPSIACAVKASKIINPDISKEVLNKGLNNTQIDGRFHKIKFKDINIILDVAHNPQATSLLAERLLDLKLKNKVIAITGMMSDKDIIGILTPLVEIVSSWHFCSTPNNERACSAKKIAVIFEKLSKTEYPRNIDITDDLDTQNSNVKSESCDKYEHFKVEDAIELALKLSNKEDTIVIFGSFLIVGAALNWLNKIN